MDLLQNYLKFEPIESFKEILLKETDSKKIQSNYFNQLITFGTAGLRGVMKPGISGINGYTIAQAASACGLYLKKLHPHKTLTVCISYDNRHHSMQFAEVTARVLAKMGILVKLSRTLRPTPWLSFAIKTLKADAGFMITASHNPKIYNGFKVYLADGGQIVSPHDKKIMELIEEVHSIELASPHDTHIELIDHEIDNPYLHMLKAKFAHENNPNLKIVYSALCGAGSSIIPRALNEIGFHDIELVKEEVIVDPEFAQIATPNPETKVAMERSLSLLLKTHADIALVSDPDADRIGCALLNNNIPYCLTGNEIALILLDYLIETTPRIKDKIVVGSFVTTHLLKKMCQENGLEYVQVLTGFKYIGQVMDELEKEGNQDRFLLGAEESYGFLSGTHAKDKDAVIISVILAKAASYAKKKGQNLYDRLLHIYGRYGLSSEKTFNIDFPEGTSFQTILKKMDPIFHSPPDNVLGEKVEAIVNYATCEKKDKNNGQISPSGLPKTEALGLFTKNSWLILRPSGTEPKLKIYAGLCSYPKENIEAHKKAQETQLMELLKNFSHKYLGQ